MKFAVPQLSPEKPSAPEGALSPLHADLLSSPDRAIFQQLNESATSAFAPEALQQRLQHISSNLEFSIDQFAESVHTIATTRDTAEQAADRSLKDAAAVLDERAKVRRENNGGGVGTLEALRGLARVLNGRR
jgi:kinetochore protein Mis13/DSN1